MIRRGFLAAIILLSASDISFASWQTHEAVNRMTDKKETWIVLSANPISRFGNSVTPYIEVQCYRGRPLPQLKFSSPVDWGRVGVNYKFDHENIRPLIVSFFKDGMTLPVFVGREDSINAKFKRGKTFKIEIFFTGQSAQFIQFDLTGGKDAYAKLGC